MNRFALVMLLVPLTAAAQVTKLADTIVEPRALYLPDGQWGHTLNGRAFQQDALTSFNGFQYTTYFDAERRLCIARRKLDASEWHAIHFDDYKFKGNDTHNASVLGICRRDGTIHLSFDHHGSRLHYRVSTPGMTSWDANLFGPTIDELEAGKQVTHVTYPRFINRPDGWLQFQFRIGGSGAGDAWLADYVDGKWRDVGPFISGKGT